MPEVRVAQKKTPDPVVVTPAQREAWRQGADYLEKTVKEPEDSVAVAGALSDSLGAPEYPSEDPVYVQDNLYSVYKTEQRKYRGVNEFLEKYQGTKLEGTGINLAAPISVSGVFIIIALCVFVPGFAGFAFWVIRRVFATTRGALGATIQAVEDYKTEHPAEAQDLLMQLSKRMDGTHKSLVRKLKP